MAFFQEYRIESKKIYGDIENKFDESLNIFKRIKTLPFIDPIFVKPVYNLICEDVYNLNDTDTKFVLVYFKKIYINLYDANDWNYFKIYDHRINNACESYHHIFQI